MQPAEEVFKCVKMIVSEVSGETLGVPSNLNLTDRSVISNLVLQLQPVLTSAHVTKLAALVLKYVKVHALVVLGVRTDVPPINNSTPKPVTLESAHHKYAPSYMIIMTLNSTLEETIRACWRLSMVVSAQVGTQLGMIESPQPR